MDLYFSNGTKYDGALPRVAGEKATRHDTCPRCGGTGNYSFNMMYGTTCFGCNGRKWVAVSGRLYTAEQLERYRANKQRAKERREAQREAQREQREAMRRESGKAFIAEHDLEADFSCDHRIVQDILDKVMTFGSISPAQIALVRKLAREERERADAPPAGPVPTGRVAIEGKCIAGKWRYTSFGDVFKVTVELPNGSKVWGSLPAAEDPEKVIGRQVGFTATVTASDDDPSFGFFKRPHGWTTYQATEKEGA